MKTALILLITLFVSYTNIIADDLSMKFEYKGQLNGLIKLKISLINSGKDDVYIYDTDFMNKNIMISSLTGVPDVGEKNTKKPDDTTKEDTKIDMALKGSISNLKHKGKRKIKVILKEGESFSKLIFIKEDTVLNGAYDLKVMLVQRVGKSADIKDSKVVSLSNKIRIMTIKK
ncbi:MAG: hypothetical protein COA79_04345 [Planctomycetota bacterium]|nr:MAG: hypothetical protein COA79_04345 [Planctomycetota bacterium]